MAVNKQNVLKDIFSKEQAIAFAETLKALGHPVRLRIVDILSNGAQSVSDLAEMVDQQQAIISQQLKILRLSGLVQVERSGGKAFYSLMIPNLTTLLNCLRSCKTHMG